MSCVTERVSEYVRERGINVSKMARDTGKSYMALYSSLLCTERGRDLRDDEFLAVCNFLGVDPRQFASDSDGVEKEAR